MIVLSSGATKESKEVNELILGIENEIDFDSDSVLRVGIRNSGKLRFLEKTGVCETVKTDDLYDEYLVGLSDHDLGQFGYASISRYSFGLMGVESNVAFATHYRLNEKYDNHPLTRIDINALSFSVWGILEINHILDGNKVLDNFDHEKSMHHARRIISSVAVESVEL